MLKQRLLTAIILVPIFVFLLLKLSPIAFGIFTGLFVLWGAWEWSALMGLKTIPARLSYFAFMVVILVFSLFWFIPYVLYSALIGWLAALILILSYPSTQEIWGKSLSIRALMGVMVLVPCWLAVNYIRNKQDGPLILLYLFILIWGADTFAYFVGKKWGTTKLAPQISPGKSWQGFLGAIVGTLLIAAVSLTWYRPAIIGLALITVLFSVLGDLFESMLKRNENLKDSGTLLPGHGGILDRIDSLTAAAPIFALGIMWLEKIYH